MQSRTRPDCPLWDVYARDGRIASAPGTPTSSSTLATLTFSEPESRAVGWRHAELGEPLRDGGIESAKASPVMEVAGAQNPQPQSGSFVDLFADQERELGVGGRDPRGRTNLIPRLASVSAERPVRFDTEHGRQVRHRCDGRRYTIRPAAGAAPPLDFVGNRWASSHPPQYSCSFRRDVHDGDQVTVPTPRWPWRHPPPCARVTASTSRRALTDGRRGDVGEDGLRCPA